VSTVLMIDLSRSMLLRGCFVAAKRVVMALNSLIRMQYPRDNLYIVGFSDRAREMKPEDLPEIDWSEYVYGTNLQHGLMLARHLLARHKSGTRQVIVITDGEPTAHIEDDGEVYFNYPPTYRTYQATLKEVLRCTRERIVINTFMLERGHYLADFINQMARINKGRAFFATPERPRRVRTGGLRAQQAEAGQLGRHSLNPRPYVYTCSRNLRKPARVSRDGG